MANKGLLEYERLNDAFLKLKHGMKSEDIGAYNSIATGIAVNQDVKCWRKSVGLSVRQFEELSRFSHVHVVEVEGGRRKLSPEYMQVIVNIHNLALTLEEIPLGFDVRKINPSRRSKTAVPISKLAASHGEWRVCPQCLEEKFFLDKRRVYCSRRCQKLAKESGVIVNDTSHQEKPKSITCPHCGKEIDNYRTLLIRQGRNQSNRQATDDTLRRLERAPLCGEVPELRRQLAVSPRVEADGEVEVSRGVTYSSGYEEILAEYAGTPPGKA